MDKITMASNSLVGWVSFRAEIKPGVEGLEGLIWKKWNMGHEGNGEAWSKNYGLGLFSSLGVGNLHLIDGIMDRFQYHTILEIQMLPMVRRLSGDSEWKFQ